MKFLCGLLLGIIIGLACYWYARDRARENPAAEQRYEESASRAREEASQATHDFSDALKAKMETLNLGTNAVTDELSRTGKVVRRNAETLGDKVADAAEDARIVTAIKAKYAVDPDLSFWKISVSCDQGHVNLSGTVSAPEYIGKAIAIALDEKGVQDVTSALEVKPNT